MNKKCIYTVYTKCQKTGKKTNRCQKINVQKLFNKLLQNEFYILNCRHIRTTGKEERQNHLTLQKCSAFLCR